MDGLLSFWNNIFEKAPQYIHDNIAGGKYSQAATTTASPLAKTSTGDKTAMFTNGGSAVINKFPGEEQWVNQREKADPQADPSDLAREYYNAVTSPGGKYYKNPNGQVEGASTARFANGNSPVKKITARDVILKATTPIDPNVKDFLEKTVFPITDKAGIPRQVAAGQFGSEGRLNSPGATKHDYYNIGAFDSNPGGAPTYDTPEAGVQAYADLLSGNAKDANGNPDTRYAKAYALRNNPGKMMQAISNAGYAGDPATYGQRSNSGFSNVSDFAQSTPEWQAYSDAPAPTLTPAPTNTP